MPEDLAETAEVVAEALLIAEAVTGIDAGTLAKASRIELLDSALHSPRAGFGDEEFYPDLIDKAAGSRRSDRSLSLGSAHREDQPVRPPHGLFVCGMFMEPDALTQSPHVPHVRGTVEQCREQESSRRSTIFSITGDRRRPTRR